MNIVLVGLMGSGKSAVGRLLAERLDRPFIDTDSLVEEGAGRSVAELFAAEGEQAFRDREAAVIAAVTAVAAGDGQVIATGGGAVLRAENRAALRSGSLVVWLDAPPEELYRRALAQGVGQRPLLHGPDPLARLAALAESRAGAYAEAADARIETSGKDLVAITDEIVALFTANGGAKGDG